MPKYIITHKQKVPYLGSDRDKVLYDVYFQPHLLIISDDRIAISLDGTNFSTYSTATTLTQGGAGSRNYVYTADKFQVSFSEKLYYVVDYDEDTFITSSVPSNWQGIGSGTNFPFLNAVDASPSGTIIAGSSDGVSIYSTSSGSSFLTSSYSGGGTMPISVSKWMNGQFISADWANGTYYFRTSSNGVTWSQVGSGYSGYPRELLDVTYGLGLYVSCGERGDSADNPTQNIKRFGYSSDLSTWTSSTTPTNLKPRSIAFSPSLSRFVAVGKKWSASPIEPTGTASICYSDNGINWTACTSPDRDWSSVVWGGDKFYAVSTKYLLTSTDGISWTETIIPGLSASSVYNCLIRYIQ